MSNPEIKQCIKDYIGYETTNDLERMKYFQAKNTDSSDWRNYATNSLMFTHCMRPTYRYGDILVQRQLKSIIDKST